MTQKKSVDVIIIGAGASGLMTAIEAGKRGRSVTILESSNKPGKKILMAGGGYCNFTNYHIEPDAYISHNPHFCKSALSQYTQWDFISLVERYQIPYHEKTKGQLFCDTKGGHILKMLLAECKKHHANIHVKTPVLNVKKHPSSGFVVKTQTTHYHCQSLVVASGGLSIPSLGASPWGYKLAEQFGIHVWPLRAGLVPLTLHVEEKDKFAELSGLSFDATVESENMGFHEACLFTHRGLSGPSILQISSYWKPGENIKIDCLPELDVRDYLTQAIKDQEKKSTKTLLSNQLPKRMIETLIPHQLLQKSCASLQHQDIQLIHEQLHNWTIKPNGTEGYRTAEVTVGGVDCNEISSKTMESIKQPGLYFVGEVLDVTGWLGGYNFQWAWSSGFVAGKVV